MNRRNSSNFRIGLKEKRHGDREDGEVVVQEDFTLESERNDRDKEKSRVGNSVEPSGKDTFEPFFSAMPVCLQHLRTPWHEGDPFGVVAEFPQMDGLPGFS